MFHYVYYCSTQNHCKRKICLIIYLSESLFLPNDMLWKQYNIKKCLSLYLFYSRSSFGYLFPYFYKQTIEQGQLGKRKGEKYSEPLSRGHVSYITDIRIYYRERLGLKSQIYFFIFSKEIIFFFFLFLPCHAACGILVLLDPQPGI